MLISAERKEVHTGSYKKEKIDTTQIKWVESVDHRTLADICYILFNELKQQESVSSQVLN